MQKSIKEFLEKVQPGETILIEYSSIDHPEIVFYSITKWADENGLPIVIHDVLDTFHIFVEHLKLNGYDVEFLKNAYVIKSGGMIQLGKIIRKVKLSDDIVVYTRNLHEILRELFTKIEKRPIIIIVLGAGKHLKRYEHQPRVLEYFFEVVTRKCLGNVNRITYLFGNPHLLRHDVRVELEEAPTRILELKEYGRKVVIKKSPYLTELMEELEVRV
ncbi:DUF257 family protein [Thermococcus barophilus]|uniref:Uncharacterized protein n=1 Tax=Thermococcus barophilus TaxID=55802 RepID=A0A0S1XFL5_THEBA|nr:DUF257 family protein [Thermococcus barophilus]ALM76583.1 hypothetical protein TBCH5v1_2695 [Thermococcus barophilus]